MLFRSDVPADSSSSRSKSGSRRHLRISAGVVGGFCCVIVAGGHGGGPLILLSCNNDLRSCVTWGSAFAIVASHALSNLTIAFALRLLSIVVLLVVWLIGNLQLEMFSDGFRLALVCITSAPFFYALFAEAMADEFILRKRPGWTISIRDAMVLTLIAAGSVLPMALFR